MFHVLFAVPVETVTKGEQNTHLVGIAKAHRLGVAEIVRKVQQKTGTISIHPAARAEFRHFQRSGNVSAHQHTYSK